ncbi:MAG: hypothetical protein ABJN13_15335 [Nitratireductor sp.]
MSDNPIRTLIAALSQLAWVQGDIAEAVHEGKINTFDQLGSHDSIPMLADGVKLVLEAPRRPPAFAELYGAACRVAGQTIGSHLDDADVDHFAGAMKAKLAKKRDEGRGGWRGGWRGPACTAAMLSDQLRQHVDKGDPVDVANLAMMLHRRGEKILPDAGDGRPGDVSPVPSAARPKADSARTDR